MSFVQMLELIQFEFQSHGSYLEYRYFTALISAKLGPCIVKQKGRHSALLPQHRQVELCHSLRVHLH